MKRHAFQVAAFVLAAGLSLLTPAPAHAEADASAQLSFSSFAITPGSGTFNLVSALQATAFAQGGVNNQFNSGASPTANAAGDYSTANGGASALSPFTLNVSGSTSANAAVPGQITASDEATGRGGVSGSFAISGGSGTVSVSFSVPFSGSLHTFTDVYGQSASAETVLVLELDGNPFLFDDRMFSIGPSDQKDQTYSGTLQGNMTLTYNQTYSFNLSADAETMVSNVPEPGAATLLLAGLALLWAGRFWAKRRELRNGRSVLPLAIGGMLLWLGGAANAMYVGSDPPDICKTCGAQANRAPAGGSQTSYTEGNLSQSYPGVSLQSSAGPTVQLQFTYNSYNADGSRAQVDTGMGLGWTHSYNTFLFQQRSHMFRMGPDGRVIQYRIGPGGAYTTDTGYFETLTPQLDGSFTVTNKEQSWWHFGAVSNTPFLVGGPIYRLLQTGDRNNNVTSLSYSNGVLTSITDVYGRSLMLGYTNGSHLSTVTDPLGRVTTFQYDPQFRMPTSITDPAGKTVQYSYNSLYQLTRMTDRDGRVYLYMYQNSRPFAVVDGAGHTYLSMSNSSNWSVDSTNLAVYLHRSYVPSTTASTDGRGNLWQYHYDNNGYVTQTINPDGSSISYTYDPSTLLLSGITDANGHTATYQYDPEGNRTNLTDALGNVTKYAYDPVFNHITSMTDPNGRITTYQYDSRGNKTNETDALLHSSRWTYDSRGNVLTDTDKNGHTTTYQYDAFGNRTNMTDAVSATTTFQYDAVGNRISMTDADGHTTTYQYDALNRVIAATNAIGGVTTYTYDAVNRVISTTNPNTNTTSYLYDERGRLITTTDAIGGAIRNGYDANDNRIATTNQLGHVTTYQYDSQNRVTNSVNPIGNVTRYAYDPVGNRVSVTDPNTNTTTYGYDALNRQVHMTNAIGGVTTYDYSSVGGPPCCSPTAGSSLITRAQDADGNLTYYHYDELNRRTQVNRKNSDTNDVINPPDAVTTTVYDSVGNVLTVTDPAANTTTYAYDAVNRQTSMVNAAGDTSVMTYDGVGNIITATAPNGNTTTNTYDALNRVITMTDEIGLIRTVIYDAVGNMLSLVDGLGHPTTFTYDGLNRRVTLTDALTQTSQLVYDADSKLTSITDRNGHTTTYAYDGLDRQVTATDPLGHTTTTAYDADSNVTSLTDANGHATTYTYDGLNRRLVETYPDASPDSRTNAYDAVGNVISRLDAKGQVITYSYNHLYQMTNRAYSPSGSIDTYTYDPAGRVLSATRNGWTDTFTYDGANRMLGSSENGRVFTYAYDIPGRVQTNTEPSGRPLRYTYDARNRPTSLNDGTPNPAITTYDYDDLNRLTARTNRNLTTSTYTYNADNWLLSIEHSNSLGRVAGFTYTYDNEGNKLSELKDARPTDSATYLYDAANRLTNFDTGAIVGPVIPSPTLAKAWSLDAVGNWNTLLSNSVPQVRTHSADNELLTINATNHFSYDLNGNLVQDPAYLYTYDEENRLTQVQRVSDSAIVAQYFYDALSRRIRQIINPAGVASTNEYFYDFARLMEERDITGTLLATYAYGSYVDDVLTMDRGGQTYYYHDNALWTPHALTDSTGSPAERYTYDAYGAVTVLDGAYNPVPLNPWGAPHSAVGNYWLFTGRQLDEANGLYYYRARYYDPQTGRFLQRDPAEYISGMDLYEYNRNNPTFYVDPSGALCGNVGWSSAVSAGKSNGNNKTKANFGFVSVSFSFTPEVNLQVCSSECCAKTKNPGKTVTDWKGTAGVTYDLSASASSWGGTVDMGPVEATAWLGLKGTVGASGKLVIRMASDYCNNQPLTGAGCVSISPYGELAVGGEVGFTAGWFSFNNGITGSARISATWEACFKCDSNGCDGTGFKYMGGSVDFQLKGCLAVFGCVQTGFSVSL